ncbi:MAG TPA: hypothetical protein VMV60_13620 [Thermoanaerobaculia bacterium]|nr:hypothetical protein [Thermoanaerobaculia bacterium]
MPKTDDIQTERPCQAVGCAGKGSADDPERHEVLATQVRIGGLRIAIYLCERHRRELSKHQSLLDPHLADL